MPMHTGDEDELIQRGDKLSYNIYPKIILPTKNTEFWFCKRYVVATNDLDNKTALNIYGNSDVYGHRSIELIYDDNHYLVQRAFQEKHEEIEELLNELQNEINELKEEMPQLYQK